MRKHEPSIELFPKHAVAMVSLNPLKTSVREKAGGRVPFYAVMKSSNKCRRVGLSAGF